ncbi:MAG: hypothetical protein GXX96_15605 [Planctomycetaceae bacterium]|nr:hypothetical protein [Planctomycetaceae bacterium]
MRSRDRGRQAESWTLRLVDAGIAAALIGVPFFMGGRTPAGQLVFAAVGLWTGLWWAIHQAIGNGDRTWRNTLAFVPMILALALVFIQLVPLPPGLLKTLSPHLYALLPLWTPSDASQTTLGIWQTLSLTPETTRQCSLLLFSGVLLFAVTVQRVRRISDVERIIFWLAISVSLMAVFGIAQFLTSNGKFFWVLQHPYSGTDECVKGAFSNRNHFAQFMALGFGAVLWWVYSDRLGPRTRATSRHGFHMSSPRIPLGNAAKALLIPICSLAVLLSFSRGGILALLASGIAALFLLRHFGRLSRRTFAVLACSGIVVCLGLTIYGYDTLSKRFAGDNSLASLDGRSRVWAAACEGFGDHPLFGTGLSSYSSVYPMYLKPEAGDSGVFYTHAENGYVQIAQETGAVGLLLALVALGFYFCWCAVALRRGNEPRSGLCFVAVLPPLLANAVHSTSDFVWYVPGCMGVVAVLGACACRLYQLECRQDATESQSRPLPRFAWAGIALLLTVASAYSLPQPWQAYQAEGPWNRYLALQGSLEDLNRNTAHDDVLAQSDARKEILEDMLVELSSVVQARPDWANAHACKAEAHRDLFHEMQLTSENPFSMRDIRGTVEDCFESLEAAKEWLPVGVGPHCTHLEAALQHAHRAVELEPLRGEAYLILAELSFLENSPPSSSAYIAQAFRVRPHDGTVLFEIGNELARAGRYNESLSCLKRSFQCGSVHQKRLIQSFAGNLPAGVFLNEFRPDADAMQLVLAQYSRPELASEVDYVLAAHAAACESRAASLQTEEAAVYWSRAADSYRRLRDTAKRRACLQRAVAADSMNFAHRLSLCQACMAVEDFVEAEKQARWCVQRKPGHPEAEKLLDRAVEKRLASSNRSEPVNQAGLTSVNAWR